MKFRDEVRTRTVQRTIGGITHEVPEKYTERVPVLPRDWDTIATRAAAGIVLLLTAVAVTWSTVSIGGLLGGGVGYAAATVFDASWLTVLILEWLSRFDARKREFPRRAGWLLVLLAAGAIFWHGAAAGSWPLAVVGALVSVIGKLLWLAVFKHIDRELSEQDAAWVQAEISRANATLAVAAVRRQVARAEALAAAELLAAEHAAGGPVTAVQPVSEHGVVEAAEALPTVPLNSANTVRTGASPVPSISALAREYLPAAEDTAAVVARIIAEVPNANPESVAATVRRERKRFEQTGGYL